MEAATEAIVVPVATMRGEEGVVAVEATTTVADDTKCPHPQNA